MSLWLNSSKVRITEQIFTVLFRVPLSQFVLIRIIKISRTIPSFLRYLAFQQRTSCLLSLPKVVCLPSFAYGLWLGSPGSRPQSWLWLPEPSWTHLLGCWVTESWRGMFPTEHHTRAARLAAKLAVDLAAPEGRRWEMWEVGSLLDADGHPMMTSPAKPVTHPQSSPLPARSCSFGIPEGNTRLLYLSKRHDCELFLKVWRFLTFRWRQQPLQSQEMGLRLKLLLF